MEAVKELFKLRTCAQLSTNGTAGICVCTRSVLVEGSKIMIPCRLSGKLLLFS